MRLIPSPQEEEIEFGKPQAVGRPWTLNPYKPLCQTFRPRRLRLEVRSAEPVNLRFRVEGFGFRVQRFKSLRV